MPFRHEVDTNKRSVLETALQEYCQENGVDPDSQERWDAGELMLILYQRGNTTVAALKAAMIEAIKHSF